MRPLVIIDMPPAVERGLTRRQVTKAPAAQHFGLQGAVEPFVLALGLWMQRPDVDNADPKPQQPRRENSMRLIPRIAPRRAIIHQHRKRQAVAAEHGQQLRPHGRILLVAAGRDHQ
jgi:hypothetical protein